MKLQYRILLWVLPLIIISIFSVGFWSIREAKVDISNSAYHHMQVLLDTYVSNNLDRRNEILNKSNLQGIDSFVNLYKEEALNAIKPFLSKTDEHMVIINSDGNAIYVSNENTTIFPKTEIDSLRKTIKSEKEKTVKDLNTSGNHNELYIARYFEPWEWIVYISINEEIINKAEKRIQNAMLGISTLFSLFTVLVIFILFRKHVVYPIDNLKSAALKISNQEAVDSIEVKSNDELGELARSMETMSASIQKYQTQLLDLQETLEDKVSQRTSELRERNEQLNDEITDRKKAEEELTYLNEALEAAQSMAKVGYWSFDIKTQIPFWSEQMFVVFGVKHEKGVTIFKNYEEIWHPDDWESFAKAVNDCSTDGTPYNMVTRIIFPDKSIHFIHTQGLPRFDQAGNIVELYGTSQDITNRKKLEEELLKMQKLESIGVLAGGIAHDFNNLLAAIRNNVYLSMIHMDREDDSYENLKSVEKIIEKAANLTQQLLTFSKGGAPVKKTASIIELIKESAEFALKGSNVNCEYNMADDLLYVEADEGQMNQVINNIILNAAQSMPTGGTIQINTENFNVDLDIGLPLQMGKYVKVAIQDQGVGISEEHLKSVFDPYFTTKQLGHGLGLSITYSIIKNHDGHIMAESEIGAGTIFTIYLPASEKTINEKDSGGKETFMAGKGKLLIMDDEEIIRESIEQLLTHKGYEVECVKDGDEAIELYKKAREASKPFDAVILDLTIRGGMGGKETIRKLLKIDPNVKAIVASGYSNDPVLAEFKEYGFIGVFAKHDKTEELYKTLYKVINQQPSS